MGLNRYRILLFAALAAIAVFFAPAASAQKPKVIKSKPAPAPAKKDDQSSVEPDKVLYQRAMKSAKQRKFLEARLDLQTLINTYPDSEYLAKAKLAVADSYYKEGGTSNLTQAIDEYKNFIVFFPFLDEAAYAQMQVAMAHYRMMEKADRDSSQALAAESEFQIFLQKNAQSPLRVQAEQNLRDVQEVLADGEFKIARFYYVKLDYAASAARLIEVSQRYPLYSGGDQALWMLGNIYAKAKQLSKNEDDKNHWADLAGKCYARIITDYPLSKLAPLAKTELTGMGMTVPQSDPEAAERMKKDLAFQRSHRPNPFMNLPASMFRSMPDVRFASQAGSPDLNPPDDLVSAREVLRPGAAGPSFGVSAAPAADSQPSAADSGPAVPIDSSSESSSSAPAGNGLGVQIIAAPSGAPGGTGNGRVGASPAPTPEAAPSPVASESNSGAATLSALPGSDAAATQAPQTSQTATPVGGSQGASPATNSSDSTAQPAATDGRSSGESSSKKKKGLKKVIPF